MWFQELQLSRRNWSILFRIITFIGLTYVPAKQFQGGQGVTQNPGRTRGGLKLGQCLVPKYTQIIPKAYGRMRMQRPQQLSCWLLFWNQTLCIKSLWCESLKCDFICNTKYISIYGDKNVETWFFVQKLKKHVWLDFSKSHLKGETTVKTKFWFFAAKNQSERAENGLCGERGSHVSWRKSRVWHTVGTGLSRAFRWYQGQLGVNSAEFDLPTCHDELRLWAFPTWSL